jgi:hypothetical protein
MATYLSNELADANFGINTTAPAGYKPRPNVQGASIKRFRSTVPLASQNTPIQSPLLPLPPTGIFAFEAVSATVPLCSSPLGISYASAPSKYCAAMTYTNANTVALFTSSAAAGAPMPNGGTLVIDLFVSSPN